MVGVEPAGGHFAVGVGHELLEHIVKRARLTLCACTRILCRTALLARTVGTVAAITAVAALRAVGTLAPVGAALAGRVTPAAAGCA